MRTDSQLGIVFTYFVPDYHVELQCGSWHNNSFIKWMLYFSPSWFVNNDSLNFRGFVRRQHPRKRDQSLNASMSNYIASVKHKFIESWCTPQINHINVNCTPSHLTANGRISTNQKEVQQMYRLIFLPSSRPAHCPYHSTRTGIHHAGI